MPTLMLRTIAIILATIVAACSQYPDPVVQEVITHARTHALNAPRVDWPAVEEKAQGLARETGGDAGRTRGIEFVLRALGDRHSFYLPPGERQPASGDTAPVAPSIARSLPPRDGFGHLVIGAWSGPPEAVADAAEAVRLQLDNAMRHDACGLILDVAGNGGGNMWPMMGGIAPLYDEGTLETFERRDGTRNVVSVADGVLHMNGAAHPDVPDLPPVVRAPRFIAVLVGGRTASSGEILALGFRHQVNARVFGTSTRGATTSNSAIPLSNGGLLALTTGRILDRAGKVQEGPLLPDEPTHDSLGAAVAWLRARCSEA